MEHHLARYESSSGAVLRESDWLWKTERNENVVNMLRAERERRACVQYCSPPDGQPKRMHPRDYMWCKHFHFTNERVTQFATPMNPKDAM